MLPCRFRPLKGVADNIPERAHGQVGGVDTVNAIEKAFVMWVEPFGAGWNQGNLQVVGKMERETGIEPATNSLEG